MKESTDNSTKAKFTTFLAVKGDSKSQKNKQSEKQGSTKNKQKEPSVSMLQLFRFATFEERIMIGLALFFSIGSGVLQPVAILTYGGYITTLTDNLTATELIVERTLPVIHTMAIMGSASLVAAYFANFFWVITGERQTRRIRSLYLHAILRQDMSWFDQHEDGSLNTRLASDTQIIQDGISEKCGLFITLLGQFIGGIVVAFVRGWPVACIMLATLPLIFGSARYMISFIRKYTILSQRSYANAGVFAEQAFQAIRTVYAFSLQNRFIEKYNERLEEACLFGIKRGIAMGGGFSTILCVLFCSFGLALWYGSGRVIDGTITGSQVYVAFTSMMIGSMSFLRLPRNLAAVSSARGAAYKIFEVIDRVPSIDPDSKEGIQLEKIKGSVEFKNVFFKYPTRPDVTTLKDLNLKIKPGKTVAFVGPSGSGKSTTIQLVQRFYDTLSGQVLIDDHDIKDINVKCLRQKIGVVSQEPVLFNMTIRQNLQLGVEEEVSDKEIINACKEANCHTFISHLPQGYDTIVGELGGMLSGGQKQRIAIARAILKNPSILLLDEATSALDTHSERLVQHALDKAAATRTTIVVAHRLSTIMNADHIVVLDHGVIIEQGTHKQLIELEGTYADLVKKQAIDVEENGVSEEKKTQDYDTFDLLRQEEVAIKQQVLDHENQPGLTRTITSVSTITLDEKNVEIIQDINAYDLKIAEEEKKKSLVMKQRAPLFKVFMAMRNEWGYLFVGVIGSAIAGCAFPIFAFLFSHVITILSVPGQDIRPGPLSGTNFYALMFLVLGIISWFGNAIQQALFEIAGEKFTKRFRSQVFESLLKQEIGFFDREENNTGALTTRLAVDARNVSEMITSAWGDVMNLVATIICSFSIAFSYSWQLTLVVLCMAPFITAATTYEHSVQRGYEDKTKVANIQSGQVAGEAIREHRTVAALHKQSSFEERYIHATDRPHRLAVKKAYLSSISAGFAKGINIYTSAIAFYAGSRFIANGIIDFQSMFTSMTVIMTASEAAGRSTSFASNFIKAKYAALASYNILERKPSIDPDLEGLETNSHNIKGDIEFNKIAFAYPARPDISIFTGQFGFSGKAGQTIALVGPSGCGKSTTIGMLERWYDPLNGTVSLDGTNINSYSLHNLRSHMALVGQEPVLFDMTIEENIRFGVDQKTNVNQEEIEEACKAANIHSFISELPQGYQTRVGDKGSQLSGGQKQRISIARALLRKPKVLLLDEATSALDSDSERLVQEALDNILQEGGRTTITIAHRLSTIRNADIICVIKDGRVIEQGNHVELLQLNGVYSDMVHQQSLNVN